MNQLTDIQDNMSNFDQNSQISHLDNQTMGEETAKFEGRNNFYDEIFFHMDPWKQLFKFQGYSINFSSWSVFRNSLKYSLAGIF